MSYEQLYGLATADNDFRARVWVAVAKAVNGILVGTADDDPHRQAKIGYAKMAVTRLDELAPIYARAVAIRAGDVDAIQSMTDEQLQAAVDAAVDVWVATL